MLAECGVLVHLWQTAKRVKGSLQHKALSGGAGAAKCLWEGFSQRSRDVVSRSRRAWFETIDRQRVSPVSLLPASHCSQFAARNQ